MAFCSLETHSSPSTVNHYHNIEMKVYDLWCLKASIKEIPCYVLSQVVYCSLTDFQETVYQTVLDTEDVTLLLRSSEKCNCQSGRTRRSCCYEVSSLLLPSCAPICR